jgi:pimeloyl-ACP methyl ester carboxylesterase
VKEVEQLVSRATPVDLCGLSLGGLAALRAAAARPDAVRRLVVCAAFERLPRGLRLRVRAIGALAACMPRQFLHRQLVAELREPHRSLAAREIAGLGSRRLGRLMREAADASVEPALVIVPTLVLCGERDDANLPLGRSLARALPNAEFEVVPRAGHVANLDEPAAFTSLVREFLAG